MAQKRQIKKRGRPPKYARDKNGKEIVGLSYNTANKMYYATFTKPRLYFTTDREEAIEAFNRWIKFKDYPENLKKETQIKDEVYKKARELISNNNYIQKELEEKLISLLDDSGFKRSSHILNERALELIDSGMFDKKIGERFQEFIRKYPIDAAKRFGVPELAYSAIEQNCCMPWNLVERLFHAHKSKHNLLYDIRWYEAVEAKISYHYSHEVLGDQMTIRDLDDALTLNLRSSLCHFMTEYKTIPIDARLEIVEDIFQIVKDAGYPQCEHNLRLIRELAK